MVAVVLDDRLLNVVDLDVPSFMESSSAIAERFAIECRRTR
jgi:hypothetical protein